MEARLRRAWVRSLSVPMAAERMANSSALASYPCARYSAARLVRAGVDHEVRGWERASDHAPTWVEIADG